MLGSNIHTIFNHFEPLPKQGIHYFRIKILKTYGKYILFGVCSSEIKSNTNAYHSPYFIGINLNDRNILGNNKG